MLIAIVASATLSAIITLVVTFYLGLPLLACLVLSWGMGIAAAMLPPLMVYFRQIGQVGQLQSAE